MNVCVAICVSYFILLAKKKDKQQEDKREKQQGDEQPVNVSVSVVVTLL